jgi:hypothetical protein
MGSEKVAGTGDTDVITAQYHLNYEFEPFEDAKYPDRTVSPQPACGRIHMQVHCPCGRVRETFTQTNLVRPRKVRCECGRLLLAEDDQSILFSEAAPDI